MDQIEEGGILEWEQRDSSTELSPPSVSPAIWHLSLGGLDRTHKYFIFMTQINLVLIPC